MKCRHADPEFAAGHSQRMKRLFADPKFRAAHRRDETLVRPPKTQNNLRRS
jgi:hypothetical protein